MKFKDPLASLNFLGGSFPIHIAMCCFSIMLLTPQNTTFKECPDVSYDDIVTTYSEVRWMLLSHFFQIVVFLRRKCLSKKTDFGLVFKTLYSFLSVTIYLLAYCYLQYKVFKPDTEAVAACMKKSSLA